MHVNSACPVVIVTLQDLSDFVTPDLAASCLHYCEETAVLSRGLQKVTVGLKVRVGRASGLTAHRLSVASDLHFLPLPVSGRSSLNVLRKLFDVLTFL